MPIPLNHSRYQSNMAQGCANGVQLVLCTLAQQVGGYSIKGQGSNLIITLSPQCLPSPLASPLASPSLSTRISTHISASFFSFSASTSLFQIHLQRYRNCRRMRHTGPPLTTTTTKPLCSRLVFLTSSSKAALVVRVWD